MGRLASRQVEPRDFKVLTARRAARARQLAMRHAEAAPLLEFLARVAEWQAEVDTNCPLAALSGLLALTRMHGPSPLARAASTLDAEACRRAMDNYRRTADGTGVMSFFARALLMPMAAVAPPPDVAAPAVRALATACPRCGHPPQVGVLAPEGHGTRLVLVCSLCLHQFGAPRSRCVACGQSDERRLGYFSSAEGVPWQAVTCDDCLAYLHLVSGADTDLVPDVDEVSGVVIDAWAFEHGLHKVQPNLMGL